MPKWFRGKDPEGVPRGWIKQLDEALAGLDTIAPGTTAAARDYVLTGSSPGVLQQLSGSQVYGSFNLWSYGGTTKANVEVFTGLGAVPPEIGVRLGRVIEATAAKTHLLGHPAHLGWIEAMLLSFLNSVDSWYRRPGPSVPLGLDIAAVEAMSVAAGRPAAEPLVAAFHLPSSQSYGLGRYRRAVRGLGGYAEAVARHAESIRPAFAATKVDQRLVVLEMLAGLPPASVVSFAPELAVLATSTSTQVRAGSLPLLQLCGDRAVPPLKEIAVGGKPDARRLALEQLLTSPADRAWALETAAADRAPNVRSLAEEKPVTAAPPPQPMPVVEVPVIDWKVEVTPELRALMTRVVDEANRSIEKANRASRLAAERWAAANGRASNWHRDTPAIKSSWLSGLLGVLASDKPPRTSHGQARIAVHFLEQPLMRELVGSGLGAAGLTKVFAEADWAVDGTQRLSHMLANGYTLLHDTTGSPTLLEIATMFDQMGQDGGRLVLDSYTRTWQSLGRSWPEADVAPFMTLHLEQVLDLIRPGRENDWYTDPLSAFAALATLPVLPSSVVEALFAASLGSRKTERRPAQDALAKVPGIEDRVVAALTSGKSEVRMLAAQWLGRLAYEPAVPALETAVAKEKQDVAIGAMLDALQVFGRPVEKYLDRDALAAQAEKAVAKGLPKDMAWLNWDGLPALHWSDGGAVPRTTVQWLLAQAVRTKSAEPNALLRKYCAMFDPAEREPFGQYLLEAWVAEDLKPIDAESARQLAEQQAGYTFSSMQRWPQHYQDDPLRNATKEQITAAYLPTFLKQPAGSATASKGLLAVAAACAGERAAPVVQRYLKEWYGLRASQGRALIVMLAWIDHPGATQLMLSVGSRFRTKSLQDEATRQAELLAERKGWTIGELADRTIPSAGFDETGVLELSYGPRVFTARLLPDLGVELRSPEGGVIKALPSPRQTDDEVAVKAAKKSLTSAKKELKAIGQLQGERLYEALCTERTWSFDDWQRYLNAHPVLRHLTQRLAWTATTDDAVTVFRPLADGTLTDVDDEPVTVPGDARVAVAHDSLLPADQVAAWQEHLLDYEVTPLFQQFGKGSVSLPEETLRGTGLEDFAGHLVEAFALRGRAGKLGYTRGQTEDGGWFYTYQKRFPTLGLSAEVEFSGNFLPEENRTVALKRLSFVAHAANGSTSTLRLSDVPAVLLSEAWNDLRLMAADGSGFDPEWEKKVEY